MGSQKDNLREYLIETLEESKIYSEHFSDDTFETHVWSGKKQQKRLVNAFTASYSRLSELIKGLNGINKLDFEACLVNVAGVYGDTPENLEDSSCLEMAAALWMRDKLEETPNGVKILSELENDSDIPSFDDVKNMPSIHDPVRSEESVINLTGIVKNRLAKNHYIYETYSPARLGSTDKFYRKLIDLVDPADIEQAEAVFLDRYMAYIETALKIAKIYIQEMHDSYNRAINSSPGAEAIMRLDPLKIVGAELPLGNPWDEFRNDLGIEMYFVLCNLPYLMLGDESLLDEIKYKNKILKIVREFDPLHTSNGLDVNPFTMSFGYCRLMDRNDDLIFLLGVSIPMMRLYAFLYPWEQSNLVEPSEVSLPTWCIESRNIYAKRKYETNLGKTRKKFIGWYASLAQLVYQRTKLVLTPSDEEAIKTWIKKKNLSNSAIMLMANTIAMADTRISKTNELYKKSDVSAEEDEQKIEEPEDSTAETDEKIIEQVAQLQDILKETQKSLNESERGRAAVEKELIKNKEETKAQREELFDLRELIYRSLSEDEPEEDVVDKGKEMLPCLVKKRTVVFGGHESWRKAIKDMLIGVTFAPNKKLINADLVRHADVIWIQVNAMPHAAYYRICDNAKNFNVPIRYFTFNSATACAIQLAKADAE